MNSRIRTRLLIGGLILMIAGIVWISGQDAQNSSRQGATEISAANDLLTARLDMETGIRGFLLTGEKQFLQPYVAGESDFQSALAAARRESSGLESDNLLDLQRALTRSWIRPAQSAIIHRRAEQLPSPRSLVRRKDLMDRFRQVNAHFKRLAEEQRSDREFQSTLLLIGLIGFIGLVAAAITYLAIERPSQKTRRWQRDQQEFSDALQFSDNEGEAHDLVCRRLERIAPGSHAAILVRNNSENRLIAATELDPDSSLAAQLPTAAPAACMAVRRGRAYSSEPESHPLQECKLCGGFGSNSVCLPTLVGGEVIGSALVGGSNPIASDTTERLEEAIATAAPVLGNLRNLAIAETRAVTDSLTGLANTRSAADTVKRMAAFAGRTKTSLAAILFDLDHFKRVNDNFGHQIGDEVLAAVGRTIAGVVRASDFSARHGGEEFLVICQDTERDQAVHVAEKLRHAVSALHVAGYTGRITASFGVAAIPRNAGDADGLIRAADQALYAAKDAGRDQVVAANGEDFARRESVGIADDDAADSAATVPSSPG